MSRISGHVGQSSIDKPYRSAVATGGSIARQVLKRDPTAWISDVHVMTFQQIPRSD
jgi:hypothetical protein